MRAWLRLICRLKGHDWVVAYFVYGPAGGWCQRCRIDYYPDR